MSAHGSLSKNRSVGRVNEIMDLIAFLIQCYEQEVEIWHSLPCLESCQHYYSDSDNKWYCDGMNNDGRASQLS